MRGLRWPAHALIVPASPLAPCISLKTRIRFTTSLGTGVSHTHTHIYNKKRHIYTYTYTDQNQHLRLLRHLYLPQSYTQAYIYMNYINIIHADRQADRHTNIPTHMCTCMNVCIHPCIGACLHTYVHTSLRNQFALIHDAPTQTLDALIARVASPSTAFTRD